MYDLEEIAHHDCIDNLAIKSHLQWKLVSCVLSIIFSNLLMCDALNKNLFTTFTL